MTDSSSRPIPLADIARVPDPTTVTIRKLWRPEVQRRYEDQCRFTQGSMERMLNIQREINDKVRLSQSGQKLYLRGEHECDSAELAAATRDFATNVEAIIEIEEHDKLGPAPASPTPGKA